jgi:glycosyltransferase involved in cell wall biosynthesis
MPEPGARSPAPLTILVPVYNEAENFPRLVEALERDVPQPFTLLVVYDFDADTTVPVARRLAEARPWIRLHRNTIGRGPANALRAGFAAVERGPVLVVMADLSDDLTCVPRLLELYRRGFGVVCPSRYMRGGRQLGGPPLKRFLSRLAGVSLHLFAGLPTHDATNNFRLYDAALVRSLKLESVGGFEVALELTAKAFRARVPIAEVPTTWRDRTAGESRFRLMKWLPRYLRWYLLAAFGLG